MKRALILIGIFVLTGIFCIPIMSDCAQSVDIPYVVIGTETWMLSKDSGQKLFLLPHSYYAKIDNIDENYYYVSFNGVGGKVEKNNVSTVGYHTEAEGTLQELKVDAKYSIFTEIKLKSSMEGASNDIPVPVDGSLIFIGKYPLAEEWYYVKYDNLYGYIKAEFTNKTSITINDFIPAVKPVEPISDGIIEEDDNNKVIKILVITGLSVVLITILIVLFRPTKSNKHRYYYED